VEAVSFGIGPRTNIQASQFRQLTESGQVVDFTFKQVQVNELVQVAERAVIPQPSFPQAQRPQTTPLGEQNTIDGRCGADASRAVE
jgi:hypothetical protein